MVINQYFRTWCDEEYDVAKEDFYESNARYIADREWILSGIKHGVFILIFAFISYIVSGCESVVQGALSTLVNTGILTVAYWFFGIRTYDANDADSGILVYFLVVVFLFLTKNKVGDLIKIIFAIPANVLYLYLCFYRPIRFIPFARKMRKMIKEEELEEEKRDSEFYNQWKAGYNAFREELPPADEEDVVEVKEDPRYNEARAMFDGFCDNKQMLKARFRQLAKEHHPDRGGDTRMFQIILDVYDNLNGNFAA